MQDLIKSEKILKNIMIQKIDNIKNNINNVQTEETLKPTQTVESNPDSSFNDKKNININNKLGKINNTTIE